MKQPTAQQVKPKAYLSKGCNTLGNGLHVLNLSGLHSASLTKGR